METHDISEKPAYKDADQLLRIKEDTYTIVGTVAYLIGVQRYNIENRGNQTEIDAYDLADKDKSGRIIHYLCLARTRLERNFRNIKTALRGTASIYFRRPDNKGMHRPASQRRNRDIQKKHKRCKRIPNRSEQAYIRQNQ